MIKWNCNSQRKKQLIATFTDVKICEDCINDAETFKQFLELLEEGVEKNPNFPSNIQKKIIDGMNKLNKTGYFD